MESRMRVCPNCDGKTALKIIEKNTTFRGEDITFQFEAYVCEECDMEIATVEQTAETQNTIADAYRKKVGLLTGAEIREKRGDLGFSQKELAKRAGVGIASIKRWENGIIQTKSMNSALRSAFNDIRVGNNYTGNRVFSITRIKLVLKRFEAILGEVFLKKGDKMLYDAKFTWYADMWAYEKLGKSITGASYAALNHGPQLNNYKELVEDIRNADETEAEPLTLDEQKIILRIALTFPTKRLAFDAAHREEVFINKKIGEIIPYADASKLTEISLH
jgi:putative zinc finger/helix-turn-helix YgiT family protein